MDQAFPEISIVIPVYNESESIRHTIDALKAEMARSSIKGEIIAVDDGSNDDTASHIEGTGAVLVRHPRNLGYGASLKSGIRAARNEWVVITDADLTYPAEQLPDLLKHVPAFDMAVGARQGAFYHGTIVKSLLRGVFKFLVEFVTGNDIPDINSGFRVFRKSVVMEFIPLVASGFSFTTTMTLIHFQSGRRVVYVPVKYSKRAGKSHVKLLRDGLRSLQFIVEITLVYNPIKAFLLLAYVYILGSLAPFALLLVGHPPLAAMLWLVWTTITLIMALGFLATAVQLGRAVKFQR